MTGVMRKTIGYYCATNGNPVVESKTIAVISFNVIEAQDLRLAWFTVSVECVRDGKRLCDYGLDCPIHQYDQLVKQDANNRIVYVDFRKSVAKSFTKIIGSSEVGKVVTCLEGFTDFNVLLSIAATAAYLDAFNVSRLF